MSSPIIYLFNDGSWAYAEDYRHSSHPYKDYLQINIGTGWTDREVSEMIKDYYSENLYSFGD